MRRSTSRRVGRPAAIEAEGPAPYKALAAQAGKLLRALDDRNWEGTCYKLLQVIEQSDIEPVLKIVLLQQMLFNRMVVALSNLRNLGRVTDVDEILRSQAEHEESSMETSYALLRGFVWAIPVMGFIGFPRPRGGPQVPELVRSPAACPGPLRAAGPPSGIQAYEQVFDPLRKAGWQS